MEGGWKGVGQLSSGMGDFTEFLRAFRNKIRPDGMLDDKASPQLASVRREMEKQKRGIQESLRGHLPRMAGAGAIQEELVTIRGERFVIPVKAEQKRRVQGVVHGASSSGQTVFVEPLETIEQNNELVRLLEDEQAEVRRILLEMTRRIGERAKDIASSLEILAERELQFAKARFPEEYDCGAPQLGSGESPSCLVITCVRHPSPTLMSFRGRRRRSRWCCSMNSGRRLIRKKGRRWRWRLLIISCGRDAPRLFRRIILR